MGENTCRWYERLGVNAQNTKTTHAIQHKKKKLFDLKMSRKPEHTVFQSRQTDR